MCVWCLVMTLRPDQGVFSPYVPRISSRFTTAHTRIKWLLKKQGIIDSSSIVILVLTTRGRLFEKNTVLKVTSSYNIGFGNEMKCLSILCFCASHK